MGNERHSPSEPKQEEIVQGPRVCERGMVLIDFSSTEEDSDSDNEDELEDRAIDLIKDTGLDQ